MAGKTSHRQPAGRRRAFRIAAMLVGLLPFVIAEAGLRLLGLGTEPAYVSDENPLSAIDRDPLVDLHSLRPLFVRSADGERMEIGSERMNYFCPASFPLEKGPQTYRVFALGGSTTQGQPYRTETAFPKWLELRLRAAMPEREIEVINCGGISYASYRVAAILQEVLDYEPDLIVLYTGHNEFLEARTYARQRLVPRWAAPAVATVSRLRLARVTASALRRLPLRDAPSTAMPAEVDTILDQPDGTEQYRRDSEWVDQVHAHFHLTLRRMLLACREAKVPAAVCVPTSDWVNTPPFKSEADPELPVAVRERIQRHAAEMNNRRLPREKRIAAAKQILALDAGYAQAHYVIGTALYAIGDPAAAEHLRQARDSDVCPLRATETIERSLRKLAAEFAQVVIDTPALFDRLDHRGARVPDGIPDPSRFVDHVHPTIGGHQEIAAALAEQLIQSGLVVTEETPDEIESEFAALRDAHLATLDETYYGRAMQRLEGVRRWTGRPTQVGEAAGAAKPSER